MILRAAWGFTVETATQAVRLVLSGVFDAYPNLKIILGHLGEGAAVHAVAHRQRARAARAEVGQLPRRLREPLLHHHQRLLLQPGAAVLR